MTKFINYAHRGASQYRPENTKISFDYGILLKANGIETDVQMTKDGHLVLFHDDVIDKKSNSTGKIIDYTLQELKSFDFGQWFDEKYSNTPIMTFEDFADNYFHLDLDFAIELKAKNCEEKTLEIIKKHNALDKIIITSFEYDFLENVYKLDKNIRLGWLVSDVTQEKIDRLKKITAYQICPEALKTSVDDVNNAKNNHLSVRTWGIYNEEIMKHALSLGVDGMTVNFPDKLFAVLRDFDK